MCMKMTVRTLDTGLDEAHLRTAASRNGYVASDSRSVNIVVNQVSPTQQLSTRLINDTVNLVIFLLEMLQACIAIHLTPTSTLFHNRFACPP